jgi:hypothetical protein
MLPDALWEALRLEPRTLQRRADFFLAYAESLTQILDPDLDDLIERAEVGDWHEAVGLIWLGFEAEGDEDPDDVGIELIRREPSGFDVAVRADALREAALAEIAIDAQRGLEFLHQSGKAYEAAGIPYGLFLRALVDPAGDAPTVAGSTLTRAWSPPDADGESAYADDRPEDRVGPPLDGIAAVARDPAQQLYLALATRQDPGLDDQYRRLFNIFAEQPQAQSSVAVGTTGLPLSEWWGLVWELSSFEYASEQTRADVEARLRGFAIEHGRQLSRAQRTAQWHEGRAGVDIVDLDVAAATCLASRRMRVAGVPPLTDDDFADVDPLAMVSLSVGLAMARNDEDSAGAGTYEPTSL